ncbi:MAG: hypothetical protein B7Y61_20730, partial [Rhizobiales bacterium 35-66-30]
MTIELVAEKISGLTFVLPQGSGIVEIGPKDITLSGGSFGQLISEQSWVADSSDHGLSVGIASWADAVGTDTFAFADLSANVQSLSWGSVASGTLGLAAVSFGAEGDAVAADVGSTFDFCGADFVFLMTDTASGGGICDG